jgi:hypothetical protein
MLKRDVNPRGRYVVKVSGREQTVRLTGESRHGGWDAVNEATHRSVRIRTAGRLRRPA